MAGKHEGLKNEINRGSTEKRQDAILMTSSHRQKCRSKMVAVLQLVQERLNKRQENTSTLCCLHTASYLNDGI